MAHFEKGSHVLLLFLSCFVSWRKTTAAHFFFFFRVRRKGRADRRMGWEAGGQRGQKSQIWGTKTSIRPLDLWDGVWNSALLKSVADLILN